MVLIEILEIIHYTATVRNETDTLLETFETFTSNDKYKNFVTTHIDVAGECIRTKTRDKCRVLLEAIAIREKRIK